MILVFTFSFYTFTSKNIFYYNISQLFSSVNSNIALYMQLFPKNIIKSLDATADRDKKRTFRHEETKCAKICVFPLFCRAISACGGFLPKARSADKCEGNRRRMLKPVYAAHLFFDLFEE